MAIFWHTLKLHPEQTPYIDVCDDTDYSWRAKGFHEQAKAAGVPAITTAGIYPGVSNGNLCIIFLLDFRTQFPLSFLVLFNELRNYIFLTIILINHMALHNSFQMDAHDAKVSQHQELKRGNLCEHQISLSCIVRPKLKHIKKYNLAKIMSIGK